MKNQELDEITKSVLVAMNGFYNHIGDDIKYVRNSIKDVDVEYQIDSEGKTTLMVSIMSSSPGLIIGWKGKDIKALTDCLADHFNNYDHIKVELFEDKISGYWRTYEQEDYYDDLEDDLMDILNGVHNDGKLNEKEDYYNYEGFSVCNGEKHGTIELDLNDFVYPEISEKDYGVHQTHCCVKHGCKYGNRNCPVELGIIAQDYPCEDCDNETKDKGE